MTYSVLYILSIFLSMAVLACHLLQWIALMVTVCILCVLRIIPQYWWPNWVSSRAWDGGQNQIARSLAHSKLTETLSFRTVSEPVRGQCLDKEEDVFGQIRKTLSEQGQGRCPNSVIDVVRTWPRTLSEQGQGRPVKSNKAKIVVWTRPRMFVVWTRPWTFFEEGQGRSVIAKDVVWTKPKRNWRWAHFGQLHLTVTTNCYTIIYEETFCVHFLAVCGCCVR